MDKQEIIEDAIERSEAQVERNGELLPGAGWKVITIGWTWRDDNECPPEEELARRLNEERFQKIVSVTPVTLARGGATYIDTVEVLIVGY